MSTSPSRRKVLLAGLASGAASLIAPATASASTAVARGEPADLALTHVTVIDATQSRPRRDQTVLVRGERIVAVGRSYDVRIPHGATVVDLTGKYLIPGLADLHAHSFGTERISPPLYVANGVTTVREMAGAPFLHEWRAKIEAGELVGPRSVIASPIVDGFPSLLSEPGEESPGTYAVATPQEARRVVREAVEGGADFVKTYSRLAENVYLALADEAHRRGITFAGHCPDLVPLPVALAAGQRSVEHIHTIWLATSNREPEVRAALARMAVEPADYASWFRQLHPIEWLASSSYSHRRADQLFDRLRRHRTRVTPTLAMHDLLDKPEDAILTDERLKYIPAATQEWWQWGLENLYKPGRTPLEKAQQRKLFERRLRFVEAMNEHEVPLLVGSEAGLMYAYPGFTLHDELALLVRAGLSPTEALRAATWEAAKFLGLDRKIGTVERHKDADLVVLDANPLTKIENTSKIHAVLVRGRLIDKAERVRMLADVEKAVQEPAVAAAPTGCGCHLPKRSVQI